MAEENIIDDLLGQASTSETPTDNSQIGSLDDALNLEEGGGTVALNEFMKPGVRLTPEQEAELTSAERITYMEKIRREEEAFDQEWDVRASDPITGELWKDEATSTLRPGFQDWGGDYVLGGNPETYRPQYSNRYARDKLNSMSAGELASLELQLYRGGYLTEEPGLPSGRSIQMVNAFTSLVREADSGRNDWEQQLTYDISRYQQYLEDKEADAGPSRPGFTVPDFRKPDYASLAQLTKDTVRSQLGRNPSESEMTLLTDYLGGQYRNQWQQNEVDVQRSAWEKNGRAAETGEEQGATTIPQVDPVSRFNEFFDDRYEGELAHRKRADASKQRTQSLFGSFDTIARAI